MIQVPLLPPPPLSFSSLRRRRRPDAFVAMMLNDSGYEYIVDGDGNPTVSHHRLLAVVDGDLDGEHVHHRLPVEWLNVSMNVTGLTASEHSAVHRSDAVVDDWDDLVDGRKEGES